MKRSPENFYGCLIGGAIGDAFGAPVEFMKYDTIVLLYGKQGVEDLVCPKESKYAPITDDTQMTMFTAEGIIRTAAKSHKNEVERDICMTAKGVFRSYLRWLYTQGLTTPYWNEKDYDGWLVRVKKMHAYREPSVTNITTLGKGIMGSIKKPLNNSKGCGGMMRVAPVGLVEDETSVFDTGTSIAAITHGHPTGCLAGGSLATIIHYIIKGDEIAQAIQKTLYILRGQEKSEECVNIIEKAVELASKGEPSWQKIKELGLGFMAEEALAIAIYCALSYPNNLREAIKLAVNHDGDSDTTGAITGNIVGAYLGADHIEKELIEKVELSKEIEKLAYDLFTLHGEGEAWQKDYPAW